eukprot:scaffold574_cov246-Pinguiococcus_pyrenoidosus.AAC.2
MMGYSRSTCSTAGRLRLGEPTAAANASEGEPHGGQDTGEPSGIGAALRMATILTLRSWSDGLPTRFSPQLSGASADFPAAPAPYLCRARSSSLLSWASRGRRRCCRGRRGPPGGPAWRRAAGLPRPCCAWCAGWATP